MTSLDSDKELGVPVVFPIEPSADRFQEFAGGLVRHPAPQWLFRFYSTRDFVTISPQKDCNYNADWSTLLIQFNHKKIGKEKCSWVTLKCLIWRAIFYSDHKVVKYGETRCTINTVRP